MTILTRPMAAACAALALHSFQPVFAAGGASLAGAKTCVQLSNAKYGAKEASPMSFFLDEEPDSVRVIITFKKKANPIRSLAAVRGHVIHQLKIVNGVAAEVPLSAIESLKLDPSIRSIELDGEVKALPVAIEDYGFGINSTDPDPTKEQVVPPGITRTGAPEAWSKTRGANAKVAIIDTGIDKSHLDLAGRVIGGKNFSQSKPAEDWNDGHGHGTHVSGTIAANDNKIGVVGMAPEAQLLGVKVLDDSGSGQYSDVIAGVQYAVEQKADVANMSLGGSRDMQALHDALKKAHESGTLVAAAAGNSGEDWGNPINYPGAYAEVVSTAAVDDRDLRAYFSTYNKFVALAAPGVGTLSLYREGAYRRLSGTSMATPHVAGAAALLKSMFPDESIVDLKRRLVCNSDDLYPKGRDAWTGHGIVNVARAMSQRAPETCDYLRGTVNEPVLEEPQTKQAPSRDKAVTYVQSLGLKLLGDRTSKQLLVTALITDATGAPQVNAQVTSSILERGTGPLGTATATTDANGIATFVLKGFTCGRFIANVIAATAPDFSLEYGQASAAIDLGGAN